MSKPILTKTYEAPPIRREEVLRYMRCKEETAEIRKLTDDCLTEILPQLSYKVCFREFEITTEALPLSEENDSPKVSVLKALQFLLGMGILKKKDKCLTSGVCLRLG